MLEICDNKEINIKDIYEMLQKICIVLERISDNNLYSIKNQVNISSVNELDIEIDI